jgi:hypothetical protein
MKLKSDNSGVEIAIQRFIGWLDKNGSQTFDPYDLMTTRYASFARKVYFKNTVLGLPFVFPIVFADLIFPGIRKILVHKKRFAIVEAHLAMGFMNMYRHTGNPEYIDRAVALCENIDRMKIEGYHGPCWGYPFDWRSSSGFWKAGTPFITVTPYCFEAFLELYKITQNEKHLKYALDIARFAFHDLNETVTGPDAVACSYSPLDHSRVLNASAYRSYMLLYAHQYNGDDQYRLKAIKGLNFVTQYQNADRSWFYAANDAHNKFIDNFHTCFVLKNLIKCNKLLQSTSLAETIANGLAFYRKSFINPDFSLKPFVKSNKFNLVNENLYDYAEAINLAQMAEPLFPELQKARDQLISIVLGWQMDNGSFITQKSLFGISSKQPYLRWGIAALFNSLSNLHLYK